MHYLYGIGAIILGIFFTVYSTKMVQSFGRMSWAERYLGAAGTFVAWKLIGVAFIIGGLYTIKG